MKIDNSKLHILEGKLQKLKLTCPLCGGHDYTALDKIFEMREFNGGDLIIGGSTSNTLPMVILVCDNCGEFKMLSAVKLGVLDTGEKKVNPNVENQ